MESGIPAEVLADLDRFGSKALGLWPGDTLIEENENSDLVPFCKPANRQFFEKIFSEGGSFWRAYGNLGLGQSPKTGGYLAWAGPRMYFCANSVQKNIHSNGLEKTIRVKDGKATRSTAISMDNLILAISSPFEQAKFSARMAVVSIRINELLENSAEFFEYSKKYYLEKVSNVQKPLATYVESVTLAARAMEYSVYSSIALSFGITVKEKGPASYCDSNELAELIKSAPSGIDGIIAGKFGFYAVNPYDLSLARYSEFPLQARLLPPTPAINLPCLKWRENAKFAASRFLAVARKSLLEYSSKHGLGQGDVFFLSIDDLEDAENDPGIAAQRAKSNREQFERLAAYSFPQAFAFSEGRWIALGSGLEKEIRGDTVGAKKTVEGGVVRIESEKGYSKASKGCIVVCSSLSPNLVRLYDTASAVISKSGGQLSHAAIVARELGVVCIAKASGTDTLVDGEKVRVDGNTGSVQRT